MAGLFNSFYYGKAGKADFTAENMPKNRWELFFDMFRIRFSSMIGLNLLYLLFCLPAIVWTAINFLVADNLGYDVFFRGISDVQYAEYLQTGNAAPLLISPYILTFLAIMILCQAIAGIGTTGMMYILRNWARDQHAFFFSDFRDAIRDNWLGGVILGAINGVSLMLGYVAFQYYGYMGVQNLFFVVPQSLIVVVLCLWWMMNMLTFTMLVTYKMKLLQVLRNCAIITIARLPWALLFWVGSLIPIAIALIIPGWAPLIVALLYVLLGFAFTGFVYVSYANAQCDRFLNLRIDGAEVNMGLRKETDEDDE